MIKEQKSGDYFYRRGREPQKLIMTPRCCDSTEGRNDTRSEAEKEGREREGGGGGGDEET